MVVEGVMGVLWWVGGRWQWWGVDRGVTALVVISKRRD